MRLNHLMSFVLVLLLAACGNTDTKNPDKPPNIILIMADDLGYSDLGCYGGEIQTPNLDYLAANGLRFTQFKTTSRCCPTRASLLTGLYSHQAGIGEMTFDRGTPGYRGYLTENTVTIAEVLKSAGYQTAMTGKWHVSSTEEQPTTEAHNRWLSHQENHPYFSPVEQYPTNRGFDRYFGNVWGVVDFFDPFALVSGTTPIETVPENYYYTDAISDTTVKYIKAFSENENPFFIYVAHTAPHWPLHALPEDIAKYEETYKVGWDVIRQNRYNKMVQLGLIDSAKAPLSPRINPELSWGDNPDKEWDARAMAVHAAMIDRMDQGIGRIIETLKQTGELDNTLILFLSDNGASPEICANYKPGFDRPGQTRSGETINYPVDKKILPGPQNTFGSIGPIWANVANTPFKHAKAQSFEGGINTPMIAFWPNSIKENKGNFIQDPAHVMDFMPTFLELANASYPETYNGNTITPFTGQSIGYAIKGQTGKTDRVLYNEHFNARYIRDGEWKLVCHPRDTIWKLYRILDDQTEISNVIDQYPDKAKEMEKNWWNWAATHQVFPKRN